MRNGGPPRPAGSTRGRRRILGLLALALLAPGCSDSGGAGVLDPEDSQIILTIDGLPPWVGASVHISGPDGYALDVHASARLRALTAGTYTIVADDIDRALDGRWDAEPSVQEVTVSAGRTTSARVTYTRSTLETLRLDLVPVASGLVAPVHLSAPAADARLFVVEQPGRIRIVKGGQLLATPFLDITSRVLSGGEQGLLSMAFAPDYHLSGYFFVYFIDRNGDIAVERYHAEPAADVADPAPSPVLVIPHPTHANHNGGLLQFAYDGMLWIGTGDGGGGGDPAGNGQNLGSLLGKLLRIDVRTLPYAIPPGNPFVGRAGARDEIWALGLRNPWRFEVSPTDGGLYGTEVWIADVGQDRWEEIDLVPTSAAGANFGWNRMEGAHCYPSGTACDRTGLTLPIHEYDHGHGCSIVGGYVYRGPSMGELREAYLYSDFCGGWLESVHRGAGGTFTTRAWDVPDIGEVLSFGRDGTGELYLLAAGGTVYRIVRR